MHTRRMLSVSIGLMIGVLYIPTFAWMIDRFNEVDSNYSHGFLIPLVIGYIIWLKKKTLSQIPAATSKLGLPLFIIGLLIHLAALRLRIEFISSLSLLITTSGSILYLYGLAYLKELQFPLFLYLFMSPLPTVFTVYITFNLKMLAAQIATTIVKIGGMQLIREGSTIITPHSTLLVDDQCSGIRSLISLMALGSIYAYLSPLSNAKKVLMFILSIPIAIIANVARIIVMIIASFIYGVGIINNKVFHEGTGILVFIVAIALLFSIQRIFSNESVKQ